MSTAELIKAFTAAFGASKTGNLMFTYALTKRLEGTGVPAQIFFIQVW